MNKAPLHSRSPRRQPAPPAPAAAASDGMPDSPATAQSAPGRHPGLSHRLGRHPAPWWALTGALVAAVALLTVQQLRPGQRVITQDDIDAAVREWSR